jgi:hypothetical protein
MAYELSSKVRQLIVERPGSRYRPILLKKSEFHAQKMSTLSLTTEPIHHVPWLFGSALIVAAWSVG